MNNISIFIFTILVMPLLVMLLRHFALKFRLVDIPNARKIHAEAVPLVGGLSLFLMSLILIVFTNNIGMFGFYLMISAGMVLVVGLLDDLYDLSAFWRFLVQIAASLLIIYFTGVKLNTFGNLLLSSWDLQLSMLAIPVTIFGVVGVINALNMADGIDGLAAMTFFSPVCTLVILSQQGSFSTWLLFLLVCVLIFVAFNKTKSYKIFLGDNGSLFLGFILAWLLVYFSQGSTAIIKPVTALYLVALPVYDTIFVMLQRILSGKSPFQPDKTHLHHLFLAKGLSQTGALFAMILAQALFIGIGVLFLKTNLAQHYQFYLFVFMSVIYYFTIKTLWYKYK